MMRKKADGIYLFVFRVRFFRRILTAVAVAVAASFCDSCSLYQSRVLHD
jgi:hypothetical protein